MKVKMFFIPLFWGLVLSAVAQVPQQFGRPNTAPNRYTGQELFKDGIYAMINNAQNLAMRNEMEKALILYDKVINTEPDFADAYMHRALLLYTIGRSTEAQRDYQQAIRLNPYIADLYGYNGKFSRLNVLAFQPERDMAELKKINLKAYESVFDPSLCDQTKSDAISTLDEQIALDTTDYYSYLARAMYFIDKEDFDLAEEDLATVNRLNPESALAYDLQGILLMKQEDLDGAEQSFRKSIELNPSFAIAYYNLSKILRAKGNSEEALTLLNKSMELNSDLAEAHFEVAMNRKKMGDKEGAIDAYSKLIELEGEEAVEAYFNRGLTKNMMGDMIGAIEDIDRVIELEGGQNPISFNARGNIHVLFGNYFLAIEDFSRAINLNGEYAEAYFNRAMANILAYNRIGACDDLDESIRLGFQPAENKKPYFCTF